MEFDNPANRIMVALDFDDIEQVEEIIEDIKGTGVVVKVGLQLGTYYGWEKLIKLAHNNGLKIFCDTKFKDIPNTVEKASRSITRHQPDFFNIMADNNMAALKGSVDGSISGSNSAVEEFNLKVRPIILAVTVLTSISEDQSIEIYGQAPASKVLQFAELAVEAGIEGVVCSPKEAELLRSNPKTKDLLLVCPGIRPAWADAGDQSRTMTPRQALEAGVDYMVIGRPITQPPVEIGSPKVALQKIIEEIS